MHKLVAPALHPVAVSLINYLLAELGPDQPRPLGHGIGMPAGAVECLEHNLVVAATGLGAPTCNDALLRFTARTKRDVVLIRYGSDEDALHPIRADVAARTIAGPLLIPDATFFRHADGGLHLLPARPDLFVQLCVCGLDLSMLPPWDGWAERNAGVKRAAAEIHAAIMGPSSWAALDRGRGA